MTNAVAKSDLKGFLAVHESVKRPSLLDLGAIIGEWKVAAFLGSGGHAEVYRVVRDSDGLAAAAKVLIRSDEASKMRFHQEVTLLSAQIGTYFAKFYASGEVDGQPYFVSELLEPIDLPESEHEIVRYLLTVCRAAKVLHQAGFIHRDIKPSNIMRRTNGEIVLIDLGLVKAAVRSSELEENVSLVSGNASAVGTLRFAAPEQMMGDKVTAATDVHAIGWLAYMAFGMNLPRRWKPIIRQATSSIPNLRYPSVSALAHAIRRRNDRRNALLAMALLAAGAILFSVSLVL